MSKPVAILQWPVGTEYTGVLSYNDAVWIDSHKSYERYRLQTGQLSELREAERLHYIQVRRPGMNALVYLNNEEELATIAAAQHRPPRERYQQAERRQAPNGEWYLAPRAYYRRLRITKRTVRYWRKFGIPILEGEELDTHAFVDANGRKTTYYSESQAQRIEEARKESAATEKTDDIVREDIAAKRCRVSVNLVRRLAKKQAIESERRPVHKGGQTVEMYFVSLKGLRRYLRRRARKTRKAKTITDPVSVDEVANLCGVHRTTVNNWIKNKRISHENIGQIRGAPRWGGGRRFVVSRSEALKYAAGLPSGDGEEWLYRFQIKLQFPGLSFRILEHYSIRKPKAYNVPPLGRPVAIRSVDRPPGLMCPFERVHQFSRQDVNVLVEWLQTRGNGTTAAQQVDIRANGTNGSSHEAARAPSRPRWDDEAATLYWGETPIRMFRSNPAKNQRDLVEAFHRANWCRTIPDPFLNDRKLNVTIYQLNKSLRVKAIRFRGDGTGQGVMWEPIE
jgi:excisionase family DNA binding protein